MRLVTGRILEFHRGCAISKELDQPIREHEAGKFKIKAELRQTAVTLSYERGVQISKTREVSRQPTI
jgi:hypothetical protein